MRALLVSAAGIVAVDLSTKDTLTSMYNHMQCHAVRDAGYPNQTHAAWADDNALLTLESKLEEHGEVFACRVSWFPETLVGNLLITGFDSETGETKTATMSIEELASMIRPGRIKPHPKETQE